MEEDPYKSPDTNIENENLFVPLRHRLKSWLWSFILWFNILTGATLVYLFYFGEWGNVLSLLLIMNICFILGVLLLSGSEQVEEDNRRRK